MTDNEDEWTGHIVGRESTESIGERIRRLRLERGLSLRQLASPGASFTYLSRVEGGSRVPSVHVIRKLARKLGVSPEYLETGVELTTREELDLALSEVEIEIRLEPENETAEKELRAIITLAEREGESDIAAKARASCGMALAAAGRLSDARGLLEAATSHPSVTVDVFLDAYSTLISVYRRLRLAAEAVALCERILRTAHPGNGVLRTVVATQMSDALSDLGDFSRAEQVLHEYAGDLQLADPYARARMHWSLARMATAQEERRLALRHMRAAIALLRGTEDTVRLARAHVMCGLILLWGGKTAGVARHVEASAALLPAHADVTDRGHLQSLQAFFAARQGRFDDAARLAGEALELLAEHERDHGVALYAQGLAYSAAGRLDEAEVALMRAVDVLESISLWREASIVARDGARALELHGDAAGAARWNQRACELEEQIPGKRAVA